MGDGVVKVQSAPTGDKNIDNTELTVGANTVERQRVHIAGAAATELADVRNGAPGAGDLGLVTRNIPSGTQPVSSAAASQADGHSASIGATTDAASALTLIGRVKQLVALLAGGLPAALAGSGGLKVDVGGTGANATAIKVDGSAATQPVSGTTTANQGTANATPWNENLAQLGGAAVSLGQKVAASSIPVVIANDASGATQGSAIFVQPRKLITYQAVFRLAARPYALSNVFGAAGRKQLATIHHVVGSAKTVKLRHCWVALESASAAGIIVVDLIRITSAPVTGNPAITPSPANPGDAAADSVCLALPTTAGTEAALQSMAEWNLGITAAGSVVNPPPPLSWVDLCAVAGIGEMDFEGKVPMMRPATLEGWAVTADASAALTLKGYVIMEFTEE